MVANIGDFGYKEAKGLEKTGYTGKGLHINLPKKYLEIGLWRMSKSGSPALWTPTGWLLKKVNCVTYTGI